MGTKHVKALSRLGGRLKRLGARGTWKPRSYCTQPRPSGEGCETCSLVNYGRDCMNNRIEGPAPGSQASATASARVSLATGQAWVKDFS